LIYSIERRGEKGGNFERVCEERREVKREERRREKIGVCGVCVVQVIIGDQRK